MKVTQISTKTKTVEYDSLHEFYDYICNTPINEAFRWEKHESVNAGYGFTKTHSFEEATELFKSGWSDMATKLVQRLKVVESKTEPTMKPKNVMSMAGYQAIVPMYLNGQPNCMVSKKMTPVKQKVITLNKSIDYNGGVDADKIIEESIKAMQIVKKLEAQGYRCNLNLILGTSAGNQTHLLKIRIKSANEKLNVSKLAFPLVHPSMLRRLYFRWIEVFPGVCKDYTWGYGRPNSSSETRKTMAKGEYLLPNFIKKDVNQIRGIEDLENL